MKFKLDENLPLQIAVDLRSGGYDIDTVQEEGLAGRLDMDVWDAAQREGRILITQDLDFSDIRKFQPGTHYGIVVIRLQAPSRQNLLTRVRDVFQVENVTEWTNCFVVVTERKIRVKKPGSARN